MIQILNNKKNDIKLIIYNNKNKINKDLEIALLIS